MEKLLADLTVAVESGKMDRNTPYPKELAGKEGVSELTVLALEQGIDPALILREGLIPGMTRIGEKFSRGEAFIPNMLLSAKAMSAGMVHLQPYFSAGDIALKGTLILGTVQGDLHDIGKNLVKMIIEGNGWNVVDLGTDVPPEKFVEVLSEHPGAVVGMSALLTTTMLNMEAVVKAVQAVSSDTKIYIGGAPVSQAFSDEIGADGYFKDPQAFSRALDAC